jgi:hypothetical protein
MTEFANCGDMLVNAFWYKKWLKKYSRYTSLGVEAT